MPRKSGEAPGRLMTTPRREAAPWGRPRSRREAFLRERGRLVGEERREKSSTRAGRARRKKGDGGSREEVLWHGVVGRGRVGGGEAREEGVVGLDVAEDAGGGVGEAGVGSLSGCSRSWAARGRGGASGAS